MLTQTRQSATGQDSHALPGAVLNVRNLVVEVPDGRAVDGVDIDVSGGQTHCLVGESGCGKSLTCLAIMGLLPARARITGGSFSLSGKCVERGLAAPPGLAMIYQDATAALNPVISVGRQIAEALPPEFSGGSARAEARRLMDLVGIASSASRFSAYPHEFSGGMNQRIAIAMALAGRPRLLIADEPTTALDVTIQAQILRLLRDIQDETGLAILFVTHDLGVVAEIADEVSVMYCGRVVENAPVEELFDAPAHPYSKGLLDCVPTLAGQRRELTSITGVVPALGKRPPGCAFSPRCGRIEEMCATHAPPRTRRSVTTYSCFNPWPGSDR